MICARPDRGGVLVHVHRWPRGPVGIVLKAGDLARSIDAGFEVPQAGASQARAAAFHRASRHSRRVRWLKFLIPAAAVAMMAGFALHSWLSTPAAPSVEVEGTAFSEGKLIMDSPRLEGLTSDGKPYRMTAERAIQTIDDEGIIDLEVVEARIPADDGNWARVVAPAGVYDRAANTLSLSRDIVVTTTDGAVARLSSALLDIAASTLKSSEPVQLERHGSWVTAASMEMLEGGKRLIFETRVRMNIVPASADAGKQQASGGTNAVN
jgi:lipopolysaccharide export system protein LptC